MRFKYNVSFSYTIPTRRYFYLPFISLKFFLKPKLIRYIFLTFLLFIILSSCKDNPVSTKKTITETIDTIDAYTWRIDTIWGYTLDKFYVADSNNIFFMGGTGGFLRHNGNINEVIYFNDPGFINFCIDGYDKNSIFIGGGYWDTVNILKLKFWDGSSFTDYTVPNDTSWDIASVLAVRQNEAWFCSEKHNIFHLLNGNITSYRIDSMISTANFFKAPDGNIYLFTNILVPPLYSYFRNYSYKFNGNKFEIMTIDTCTNNSSKNFHIYPCGNDVIRGGYSSLSYFNKIEWQTLFSTDIFHPDIVGGISKDNLIIRASNFNGGIEPLGVYIWNGAKLFVEKNYKTPHFESHIEDYNLFDKEGRLYFFSTDIRMNVTYLFIGIPKTKERRQIK